MKSIIILSLTLLSFSVSAFGKSSRLQKQVGDSRLSTDIRFDGHVVGGKIQTPFESLTVVENEKDIDDLIGVRTNFSDRSKKAKGMR